MGNTTTMSVIFDCRTSLYTEIPQCWESITVNTGIPVGDYVYKIETPYGKIYSKEVHVETVEAGFVLASTDFPDGLFNPWIGLFELRIFELNGCTPVQLEICDETYQSIIIQTRQITEAPEIIYLVCPCPEVPAP